MSSSSSSTSASAVVANPNRETVLALGSKIPWENFIPQFLSNRDVTVIKRFSSEPPSRLQELLSQGATRSLQQYTADQEDARYYPRALLKVRSILIFITCCRYSYVTSNLFTSTHHLLDYNQLLLFLSTLLGTCSYHRCSHYPIRINASPRFY
jgi:hypothetical protein